MLSNPGLQYADYKPPVAINIVRAPHDVRDAHEAQQMLYFVFAPIIGGIIISANLLVLMSSGLVLSKKQQPRSVYIFLTNIAIANIITGVAAFLRQFSPMTHPSEMLCSVSIGLIVSSTLASVYSIGLIAIDRFYFILFGLQYKKFSSSKRAAFMALAAWLLGGVIGFLPAMGVRNFDEDNKFCFFITLAPASLVLATVSVGILPLIMIILLYGVVLKKALGKIAEVSQFKLDAKITRYLSVGSNYVIANQDGVRHISQEEPIGEMQTERSIFNFFGEKSSFKLSSVLSPRRSKAIKIVMFTALCYLVTWVPYFIACALYVLCDAQKTPEYCYNLSVAIESLLSVLGLANSLLFPFIYVWWHYEFRASAKRLFYGIWSPNQEPQISTLEWERTLTAYNVAKKPKRRASEPPPQTDVHKYTGGSWGYIDL